MGGPFDRTGVNVVDQNVPESDTGVTTDSGVIFGSGDDITINQPEADTGIASDSGVIFGPTDSITIQQDDAESGTVRESGVLFGNPFDLTVSTTGGTPGVDTNTTYTIERDGGDIVLVGSDNSRVAVSAAADGVTYTLSRDGDNIVLTGSDGSTTMALAATGTGGPDNRTELQQFLENIKEIATSQDLVFSGNFPQTITYTLPDPMGTITATFMFNGNFPRTITYTGNMIDTILGNPDSEFIRTFTFAGNFPTRIVWTEATVASLIFSLTENGLLTATGDASLTENGLFIVPSGYTLTENGLLMETA